MNIPGTYTEQSLRSLPQGHVIRTFFQEHEHLLSVLDRVQELASELASAKGPARAREILDGLAGAAEALIAAEPHHKREEEILFVELESRGLDGPPAVMTREHQELRRLKHALLEVARAREPDPGSVSRTAGALVGMLREHIAKENQILYPMALRAIRDPADWESMKERCDRIGYCCFTPTPCCCDKHD